MVRGLLQGSLSNMNGPEIELKRYIMYKLVSYGPHQNDLS